MGIDACALAARVAAMAILATLGACATPPAADATPDLATFLERRAACDHWRGEVPDPPDPARMREVVQQTDEWCKGTDAQLAQLKKRYRDDAVVSRRLAEFEDRVEP
jgi:hypothetical protein